ncbi:MAG: hypothetical protein P8X63_07935, partial [Desulfuromonadaceae bacterium]
SGVKLLLAESEFRERFASTVADLFEAPARLDVALESLLGERLQALPAAGLDDVLTAVEFLRARDGRCCFVLPGFQPAAVATPAGGVALSELVQPRPDCEALVAALLRDCFLVDTLDPYWRAPLAAGVFLVTTEGDILTGRGEFTAGGRQSLGQGAIHKKREMKELSQQVEELLASVDSLEQRRLQLRSEQQETEGR